MSIIVEPVKTRHLPKLDRLFKYAANTSFGYLDDHNRKELLRQNNFSRLTAAKLHPRRIVIIARRGNDLVGYAIGAVINGNSYLYWLYVHTDARGLSIGSKLISRACSEAAKRGAKQLLLSTYDHGDYYDRKGFKQVTRQRLHGLDMDIKSIEIQS